MTKATIEVRSSLLAKPRSKDDFTSICIGAISTGQNNVFAYEVNPGQSDTPTIVALHDRDKLGTVSLGVVWDYQRGQTYDSILDSFAPNRKRIPMAEFGHVTVKGESGKFYTVEVRHEHAPGIVRMLGNLFIR